LTATVGNFLALDLARAATGLGLGGAMPNLIAAAAQASPFARRASAVTIVSAGLPAGAAICALVDRIGSGLFDWTGIFIIGGLITLPVAPLILWLVAPGNGRDRSSPAHIGARLVFFGEGRGAATLLLWSAICLTMTVLSAMNTWLPTLMIHKGESHANGALAAFVFGAMGIMGGLALGGSMDRFGFARPLAVVFAMMAASATALSLASGTPALLGSAAVAGFSCCAAQFGLYALFPNYYPPTARTTGAGGGVAAGRVGSVLGPMLCGVLLGRGETSSAVVAALVPAAVGAGLMVIGLSVFARPFEAPQGPMRG
jgi:AAHS family 3-hydroxyphenylpropionic acid transporter